MDDDLQTTAARAAWLQFADGTYSESDQQIFIEGFRRGSSWRKRHDKRREAAQQRYEDNYERLYGSRKDCY